MMADLNAKAGGVIPLFWDPFLPEQKYIWVLTEKLFIPAALQMKELRPFLAKQEAALQLNSLVVSA